MGNKAEIQAQIDKLKAELEATEDSKVVPFPVGTPEGEVIDVDPEPADGEKAKEPEGVPLVTLVQVGITANGQFVFDVKGDTNIIAVEGLRRYFNERMDKEWAARIPEVSVPGGNADGNPELQAPEARAD
jgi:hypothetical protein